MLEDIYSRLTKISDPLSFVQQVSLDNRGSVTAPVSTFGVHLAHVSTQT
jgi:hypothetical protein